MIKTKYLVNAFSLNMLHVSLAPHAYRLEVIELHENEFCEQIDNATVNAVGHQATTDLINSICSTKLVPNRVDIKLRDGDVLLVVQVLERLPEGKILSYDEIKKLLKNNKVKFIKLRLNIEY